MNIPEDVVYTRTHEWVKMISDTKAEIGLTDYAQQELGDIVFVDLPQEGDPVTIGEKFADVESVKAVSDVFSPVTGTVSAVNEVLMDEPGTLNIAPYDSWLIRVTDITAKEKLLSSAEYQTLLANAESSGD